MLEYWQDKLIRGDSKESGPWIVKDDEGQYTPCPCNEDWEERQHINSVNQVCCAYLMECCGAAGEWFCSLLLHWNSPAAQQPFNLRSTRGLLSTMSVESRIRLLRRLNKGVERGLIGMLVTKGLPLELNERSEQLLVSLVLFQAVEVLCASPTSLQKFCPLKAGIQQHGNTVSLY